MYRLHSRSSESGFALLLVFVLAAGIAIAMMNQLPRVCFETQRDREEMLIERGEQYKRAIGMYVKKWSKYPAKLEDLENTNNVRYLRRRYKDPMTGKDEWRLIHAGPGGMLTDSLVQKGPLGPDGKPLPPGSPGMNNANMSPGSSMNAIPGNTVPGVQDPNQPPEVNAAVKARPSDRMMPGQMPGMAGQPAYPGQPGFDPNQLGQNASAYPPPNPAYPQQGQYPAQPGYPGQVAYPAQPAYPGQTGYPNQPAFPDQPRYPNQTGQPIYPGQQPTYPGQQPGYPGQQPVYPGQQPVYPGQQPVYPGQQPGYPGQQPVYPGQPTAYPGQQAGMPTYPQQGYPGQAGTGYPQPITPGSYPNQQYPGQVSVQMPQGGFGQPGQQGFGSGGQNQAAQMIQNMLTQPRQMPGMAGMNAGMGASNVGAGIAGVATTFKAPSIKVYEERRKYQEWEFVFDLKKETAKAMSASMGAAGNNPGNSPSQSSGMSSGMSGFSQSGSQSGFGSSMGSQSGFGQGSPQSGFGQQQPSGR